MKTLRYLLPITLLSLLGTACSSDKDEPQSTVCPPDPIPQLQVIHTANPFTVPTLQGRYFRKATIEWGDGAKEDYVEGASHQYRSSQATHTVLLYGLGADLVQFSKLEGIKQIDFSRF